MRIIYTAIFGNYDRLWEPTIITPGWKYICFTDQPIKSKTWEIVNHPIIKKNPRKTARYIKINWKEYITAEESIWIDSSFQCNVDLNNFWDRHMLKDLTSILHPFRDCVYDEIKACIQYKKDKEPKLIKQHDRYKKSGMPTHNGMISSGILMRRDTPDNANFCKVWWKELDKSSVRDQPAFAYTAWKTGIEYHIAGFDYMKHKDFIFKGHK